MRDGPLHKLIINLNKIKTEEKDLKRPNQCWEDYYFNLKVLTVYGQYTFSGLTSLKLNIFDFTVGNELHEYNTSLRKHNLDIPFYRLSKKKDSYPSLAL